MAARRIGCAKRTAPPDWITPAAISAVIASSRSAESRPDRRAASVTWAPSPSTLNVRASTPARVGSRARRSSTVLATPRGTSEPTPAAAAAFGCRPRAEASSSSSPSRNGLPPVTSRHARTKAGSGSAASRLAMTSADRRGGQWLGSEQLDGRVGGERGGLGHRRGVERARGGDERERLTAEPPGDEGERAGRRRVAPLQVVDREDGRRIGRQVRGEPVQAVLPRVARVIRGRAGRRRGRHDHRSSSEHVRRERRGSRQPALALVGGGIADQALEQLPDHPEREALFELGGARGEDAVAELGCPGASHLEQPRLADPRGSLDHHHEALATSHRAECPADPFDLVLAFEQRTRLGED